MSDDLDSDDILRAIEAPSSEFDPNMDGVSDDGWGSNVNSEMGDTDKDPDFLPSDDSVPGSESDDNEVVIIESMDCSDEMIDSVIEDVIVSSESENVNIENVEREVVNIEGIDREDFTVNLGEKFKSLKTKKERLQMIKDELEKWQLFEGKQKHIVFDETSNFAKPEEYFYEYLSDDLIQMMVDETNRNAAHVLSTLRLNRSSRLRKWRPTNPNEMKKFYYGWG
ncbi:hypothetical protein J6590_042475 [Homalodisca vitripennis]|nr:hypothetical protein J6590_042475 [Homalodisca vitripennis]